MSENVTIEAEFLRQLMDARDASERLEFTVAEATRERDREHQRAEKFLRSLMEVRKELRKRPDAAAIETATKQRDDAVLAADRIRKDCDGLAEKANAAKSEIFRLRQELADAVQQAIDATNRAEAADTRAKFVDARATELANEKAMLADELTITRNAGESWKARCEKAERALAESRDEGCRFSRDLKAARAELDSLRARIDPEELAEAVTIELFTMADGNAEWMVAMKFCPSVGKISLGEYTHREAAHYAADAIRKHLEGKS